MPPKETTKEDVSAPATPESQTKEPLKTSEAYDDEDADIELISSDNILFKVHSYRLQCASYVPLPVLFTFWSALILVRCSDQ